MTTETRSNLGWLLDEHLGSVPGVLSAVLLSGDGLLMARTQSIGQDDAEKLAAISSTLRITAKVWDEETGRGGVRALLVESASGFGLTTAAGTNSVLSVVTGSEADPGLVSQEMERLVVRLGEHLGTAERARSLQPDGDSAA
ncbi:roadblock/LC7 domain-containing protein [Streptomyces ziwulingensis]|uniref:Roadblock/LC7 domain-containing protein n=1 Tax=Streptomyces ziwulingensis TaxID=1045501 RepID=A0ABP9AJR9_9ACTN